MHACISNIKTTCANNFIANLRRKCIIFAFILLIFALFIKVNNFENNFACAEKQQSDNTDIEKELEDESGKIVDEISLDDFENLLNDNVFDGLFNGKNLKQFVKDVIAGKEQIGISDFFNIIFVCLKNTVKQCLFPLLLIFVVALLFSLFSNFKPGEINGVGDVVHLICLSIIIVIASVLISKLISESKKSVDLMQNQMNAIFPILLVLMTNMGATTSAVAYSPVVAILSKIISNVFCYILLPLFSISLILSIVGHISENTKLNKLNGFIKSLFKWIIGTVFAVFMGYLSIKGFTAGTSDGISIKATKYAIKNYIPMLGGYISEGFELVKAGSMIVKNAIGFVGVIVIFFTSISPIILIGISELGLKLISGILEPMGNSKTASLLESISESLKLLLVVVVGVVIMFFLTIYLMTVTASNIF